MQCLTPAQPARLPSPISRARFSNPSISFDSLLENIKQENEIYWAKIIDQTEKLEAGMNLNQEQSAEDKTKEVLNEESDDDSSESNSN